MAIKLDGQKYEKAYAFDILYQKLIIMKKKKNDVN